MELFTEKEIQKLNAAINYFNSNSDSYGFTIPTDAISFSRIARRGNIIEFLFYFSKNKVAVLGTYGIGITLEIIISDNKTMFSIYPDKIDKEKDIINNYLPDE